MCGLAGWLIKADSKKSAEKVSFTQKGHSPEAIFFCPIKLYYKEEEQPESK